MDEKTAKKITEKIMAGFEYQGVDSDFVKLGNYKRKKQARCSGSE